MLLLYLWPNQSILQNSSGTKEQTNQIGCWLRWLALFCFPVRKVICVVNNPNEHPYAILERNWHFRLILGFFLVHFSRFCLLNKTGKRNDRKQMQKNATWKKAVSWIAWNLNLEFKELVHDSGMSAWQWNASSGATSTTKLFQLYHTMFLCTVDALKNQFNVLLKDMKITSEKAPWFNLMKPPVLL